MRAVEARRCGPRLLVPMGADERLDPKGVALLREHAVWKSNEVVLDLAESAEGVPTEQSGARPIENGALGCKRIRRRPGRINRAASAGRWVRATRGGVYTRRDRPDGACGIRRRSEGRR
jgi:hypothetical protein